MRGVTSQELHGIRRHFFLVVDDSIEDINFEQYKYDLINQLKRPAIVHVISYTTHKEIEKVET